MIQKYDTISPSFGKQNAGICEIYIAPIEWLSEDVSIDFNTGNIATALVFKPNKDLIKINLIIDSYNFDEKPKSNKAGTYYDIILSGTSNFIDCTILQILNTYRYHQFIVIAHDKKKRKKIIGSAVAGMILQFSSKEESKNGGNEILLIDFNMQSENPSVFYII